MTKLKDLIHIPERVHRGDFVLKLTDGLATAEERRKTLDSYVVTDQLSRAFNDALSFIRSAVEGDGGRSKAAYLHGSFGSGKSHFMAVLHLLLGHDADARSIPALAPVVTEHDTWMQGRKFLLVPFHMIGASSMEAAVLGQYVDYVLRLHPDAPMPGVFVSESLFHDALEMRKSLGDEAFFARLNEGGSSAAASGWGALASKGQWDAERFDAAITAPAGDARRSKLVGALVDRFFKSYRQVASASSAVRDGQELSEGFVDLDTGLAVINAHARDLGYDALVLFLDELILWLASRVGDLDFVSREGQKVSKLIESTRADRPIPLVSFVARQRDLRELVGESVPGSEKLSFVETLKWWEGRFHKISLEDRNLAAIAERRLLRAKDPAARQKLENAFQKTLKTRSEVIETLLTREGDRKLFQQVFPFTPALVTVLVALSSVLQRERTAIRVMLQLLVDQRETLELGDLIPVGDLWDVIAEEAEPFSDEMRRHFENAQRLYTQKILPLLEKEHGLEPGHGDVLPADDPRAERLRNDGRLLKTLLLAALVPDEPSLKELTADRLEALNHGTIRAPIAGREKHEVMRRMKSWASRVGELKISEGAQQPILSIQLSGVDTEAILDRARVADTPGARSRKIREMVFAQVGEGIQEQIDNVYRFTYVWKGTRRRAEVVFGNVREMSDDQLRHVGHTDRVLIDFPFDPGHSPADDQARIQKFRDQQGSARTLAWLPRFFSPEALRDLGTLVVMDHVLTSDDRFRQSSEHLSAVDRAAARNLLENQRSALRHTLEQYVLGAYGVATPPPGCLDDSHEQLAPFHSLDDGFDPRPPTGRDLGQALCNVLAQRMEYVFPAHPDLGEELVEKREVRKVYDEIRRAFEQSEDRLAVDSVPMRVLMKRIAEPLRLGTMYETHFVLDRHWRRHFDALAAGAQPTVGQLRQRLDEPDAMGLPTLLQNLILLVWAEQTDRVFRFGGPVDPTLDDLRDELTVEEQDLPSDEHWSAATELAGHLFGLSYSSRLKNAANVARFVGEVKDRAGDQSPDARRLVEQLKLRQNEWGLGDTERLRTAEETAELTAELSRVRPEEVPSILASVRLKNTPQACARSLKTAAALCRQMQELKWHLIRSAVGLTDARREEGQALRTRLLDTLSRNELAKGLGPELESLETEAADLLARAVAMPAATEPGPSTSAGAEEPTRESSKPEPARAESPLERVAAGPAEVTGEVMGGGWQSRRLSSMRDLAELRAELEPTLSDGAVEIRFRPVPKDER